MRRRLKLIDISTEEKRQEVYKKLDSFISKNQAYKYFGISDNAGGILYLKEIAESVGFDLNVYTERRKKPERFCIQCGALIQNKGTKFCSNSCATTYNNLHRDKSIYDKLSDTLSNRYPEDHRHPKDPVTNRRKRRPSPVKERKNGKEKISRTYTCANCGCEFKRKHGGKFCSTECMNEYRASQKIQKFLNGEFSNHSDRIVGPVSLIRKYLYNKFNHKCQLCGFEGYNKKTGNTILQIHHIDGNSRNNIPENLQLICPNCHAMTENFMNLNSGKSTRINRYT